MNSQSFLNKVLSKSKFTKNTSKVIYEKVFEFIKQSLEEERFFEIEDFGNFSVEFRPMQTIIDYNRKLELLLPPKDKIVFHPSERLKNMLDR
ncbi:MAG: HU family DNA-binding protein [Ignavibacteria bacterium]